MDNGVFNRINMDIFKALSDTEPGRYVFVCDIASDISIWSDAAIEYFGLPDSQMEHAGDIWLEHIDPEYRDDYKKSIAAIFSGESEVHDMLYRAKNADGVYVTVTCKGHLIRDDRGKPCIFMGNIINHEVDDTFDSVTGLFTRSTLMWMLKERMEEKRPYYLLIIGLRNFFNVNNMYGYTVGNKVLKELSLYLLKIRKNVSIFRTDGTKFAFLIDAQGTSMFDVTNMFDCIKSFLKGGVLVGSDRIIVDVCGGAVYSDDYDLEANTIYTSAQFALSKAKESPRSGLEIFENSYFIENKRKLATFNVIRDSVLDEYNGFYLMYQPIVCVENEKVSGMEALLRWKGAGFGVVPPNYFIEWLEKDSVFFELGNWIIRQALRDALKLLPKDPDFIVNINIAYTQLQREEFRRTLVDIVKEVGFPPENIRLELTERCRLIDENRLRSDIEFINSYKIRVSLDDFGTGYSALGLLFRLPINQIKIDRSFVTDIETDAQQQILLDTVATCARRLGIRVCVEGIETESMKDYIKNNFDVTSFQGYYYSKPLTIDEFIKRADEIGYDG